METNVPTSLPPETRVGAYKIQQRIGVGAMGSVYQARHHLTQGEVALKVVHPHVATAHDEVRERWLREAQAAARIRHPGIVQVYDAGFDDSAMGAASFWRWNCFTAKPSRTRSARGNTP